MSFMWVGDLRKDYRIQNINRHALANQQAPNSDTYALGGRESSSAINEINKSAPIYSKDGGGESSNGALLYACLISTSTHIKSILEKCSIGPWVKLFLSGDLL